MGEITIVPPRYNATPSTMKNWPYNREGSTYIIIIIIIKNSLFKEGNSVSKEMLISPEALMVVVNFIGEGNRRSWIKPSTCP